MKKTTFLYGSLLLFAFYRVVECQRKNSPCPSVFTYDNIVGDSNENVWYGTLRLQSSVTLHGITVDVIFDKRVNSFGAYHYDEATSRNNFEFRIEKQNFKLEPGQTLVMNVYVQYENYVPLLKQIRLNGQNVCVDLPVVNAVQPIYPNSHTTQSDYSTTKKSNQRENPNVYDSNSSRSVNNYRTTQSSIDYHGSNNNNNENHHFSDRQTTTSRNFNSNNNRDVRTTSPRSTINSYNNDRQSGQGNNNADKTFNANSNQNADFRPHDLNRYSTTEQNYNTRSTRTTTTTNRPNSYTTKRDNYFPGDLPFIHNSETTTHSILNIEDDGECGTVIPKTNPLILHGIETYHGNFPWQAALYFSEVGSLKYICGGSLITMSSVLTASHCVCHAKSTVAVSNDKLLVYLGKHNLQKWTGHEQDGKVVDIIVNDEYDPNTFYSDISILKLKEPLKRTNYVRPICLWNFDPDLRAVVSKLGTVAGWGYNENGLISDELTYLQMPIVTHETCIWSNRDFFSKVTSEKSFCAGFRNGTTVCNGDSGSGLVFKKSNKWFIRGVVSVSIALQNTLKCDPDHYAVFIDVAKYISWINDHI